MPEPGFPTRVEQDMERALTARYLGGRSKYEVEICYGYELRGDREECEETRNLQTRCAVALREGRRWWPQREEAGHAESR